MKKKSTTSRQAAVPQGQAPVPATDAQKLAVGVKALRETLEYLVNRATQDLKVAENIKVLLG